jgi:hypothetical protein
MVKTVAEEKEIIIEADQNIKKMMLEKVTKVLLICILTMI